MALLSWLKFNSDIVTDQVLGAAWSTQGTPAPVLDTTVKKFGAGSMRIDATSAGDQGIGASLDIPAFETGLPAWHVKGWIRFSGTTQLAVGRFVAAGGGGELGIQVEVNTFRDFSNNDRFTLGLFQVFQNDVLVAEVVGTPGGLQGSRDTNQHYFEAGYDGTTYRFFWDGALKHSLVDSDRAQVTGASGHQLFYGGYNSAGSPTDDVWFDNVSFWNEAGHTANYTPPASEDDGFFTQLTGNAINGSVALAAAEWASAPLAANLIDRDVLLAALQPQFTLIEGNLITRSVLLSLPADGVFDLEGFVRMHALLLGDIVPSRYAVIGARNATDKIIAQATAERIVANIARQGVKAQADA